MAFPITTEVALPIPETTTQTHCQIMLAMLFAETNSVLICPIIIERTEVPMLQTASLRTTGAPVFKNAPRYFFTGTKRSLKV